MSENIEVEASVTRSVEAVLEVGGKDVVVTLTSDQPLVQTESAAISRQITGEEVTKIPTSTRSLDFFRLKPEFRQNFHRSA